MTKEILEIQCEPGLDNFDCKSSYYLFKNFIVTGGTTDQGQGLSQRIDSTEIFVDDGIEKQWKFGQSYPVPIFMHRMISIPYNFSSKCEYKCKCGRKEDMNNIYECELYKDNQTSYHMKKFSMEI